MDFATTRSGLPNPAVIVMHSHCVLSHLRSHDCVIVLLELSVHCRQGLIIDCPILKFAFLGWFCRTEALEAEQCLCCECQSFSVGFPMFNGITVI